VNEADPLSSGWWVRLEGESVDLVAVADGLSGELRVVRHGEHFYLHAPDFAGVAAHEAEAVERRAAEIVRILNGAAQVQFGDHRPISVGAVALVNEDGGIHHFVFASSAVAVTSRVRVELTIVGEKAPEPRELSPMERMTLRALADPAAERALRILGRDDVDYRDLYFVFEIVRAAAGDRIYQWASRREIERFRHTANSPSALGEAARHGHEPTQPPDDPMPIAEANGLVRRLVGSWLG
jgi:hypothetical protein